MEEDWLPGCGNVWPGEGLICSGGCIGGAKRASPEGGQGASPLLPALLRDWLLLPGSLLIEPDPMVVALPKGLAFARLGPPWQLRQLHFPVCRLPS